MRTRFRLDPPLLYPIRTRTFLKMAEITRYTMRTAIHADKPICLVNSLSSNQHCTKLHAAAAAAARITSPPKTKKSLQKPTFPQKPLLGFASVFVFPLQANCVLGPLREIRIAIFEEVGYFILWLAILNHRLLKLLPKPSTPPFRTYILQLTFYF